jgi:hypothetical protein
VYADLKGRAITRTMVARQLQGVASGSLKVDGDRTYPLSEATAARLHMESRQGCGRAPGAGGPLSAGEAAVALPLDGPERAER